MFEEKTYARRAFNFIKERWIIMTIISSIPNFLLSVWGILGDIEFLSFLYSDSGYMKIRYILVLGAIFLISVVCNGFWRWLTHEEEESNEKLRLVYKETKNMVKRYHSKCHENFSGIIDAGKYKGSVKDALKAIYNDSSRLNPKRKIEHILEYSNMLLSYISGVKSEKISIILMHKTNENSKWEVFLKRNIEYGPKEIAQLFNSKNSGFSKSLEQSPWPVFYIRKSDAQLNNAYMPNAHEIENGVKGSIYCKDLSIYDKEQKMIKGFVLAVSTDDKQLARNNTLGRNVLKETFELIEEMLKPEIDHLYMTDYFDLGGYISEKDKDGFTEILSNFKNKGDRRHLGK